MEEVRDLPGGYGQKTLIEILERVKKDVEKEYGYVYLPDIFRDRLLKYGREIAKNYNSTIVYEEMVREIISFIKKKII